MESSSATQGVKANEFDPSHERNPVIRPAKTQRVVGIIFAKTDGTREEIGEVIHHQIAGTDSSLRLKPSVGGELADRLKEIQEEIVRRGEVLTNSLGEVIELAGEESPLDERMAALCQFVIFRSHHQMWIESPDETDRGPECG